MKEGNIFGFEWGFDFWDFSDTTEFIIGLSRFLSSKICFLVVASLVAIYLFGLFLRKKLANFPSWNSQLSSLSSSTKVIGVISNRGILFVSQNIFMFLMSPDFVVASR